MATDQVSVQRYLTARNLQTARRGLWIKLALALPVSATFYATGLVLYAFYAVHGDPLAAGTITKADQILPYFVVNQLPHGLPGLFIAAIYAASMSTISAGINSLTSASLVDFYQRLWRHPNLAEHHQLRLARVLTFTYGALIIALVFLVERLGTLLEATNKVISLIGGPLVGLFLLGMVLARPTARGAVIGWGAGLGMTFWVCFGTSVSFLWYALSGCATTMVVGYLASLFDRPPADRQLEGLTWSRRRPPNE